MVDIALFPIPNAVAFPSVTFPLHVFEPRYRAMIRHCLDHDMPLGICHTQKLLSPGKSGQNVNEALQSNQATYKPHDIFSAGKCELIELLDDGRMRVNVHVSARYCVCEERQRLPFSISRCELYEDLPLDHAHQEAAELAKEKVLNRLQVMTSAIPEMQKMLSDSEWQTRSPALVSFALFKHVRLDADLQQKILERRSAVERLNILLEVLNRQ